MMNSGDPMTGIDRRPLNKAGIDIQAFLLKRHCLTVFVGRIEPGT
jgi:hypothetical protein